MKVKVTAFLSLPEKLGWKQKVVELENNSTFEDLLTALPELRKVIQKFKEKNVDLVILVNGRHIQFTGGLKTHLKDGDEVSIFPPAAGGS